MTGFPKAFTGDDGLVGPLNRMLINIKERTPLEGEAIKWELTSNGFRPVVKIPAALQAGAKIEQYRVKSLLANVLICNTYSKDENGVETVGTNDVQIARPWDLRRDTWHGKSIDNRAYTISGASYTGRTTIVNGNPTVSASPLFNEYFPTSAATRVTINEKIWPEYVPNQSVIYVVDVTSTLVYPSVDEGVTSAVSRIDLNVAGRKWEMIWKPITVCVDNGNGTSSNRRVLIRASEEFT